MNNKENMLNIALEMFSKRGYSGVSVRDICGAIGLKESALYYHFKNKEDLLNTLYSKVDALVEQMRGRSDTAFLAVSDVSVQEMCMVSKGVLCGYYCDEYVSKLISMLSIERNSMETANKMYQKLVYDTPLVQCTKVFSLMQEKGIIQNISSEYLAKEYVGIIYFAYDRLVAAKDDRENAVRLACEEVEKQITIFYEHIVR